jgi:diguanylate cyclase (GGDEF)-like protein
VTVVQAQRDGDVVKLFSRLGGNRRPAGLDTESLREATRSDWRGNTSLSADKLREYAGRRHELAVLSLFLHSAGTPEEMLGLFLERSPRATGAVVTYPLLLDRRREVLTTFALSSIDDPGLHQASLAAEENLADIEFPLPLRCWRRDVLEAGEVVLVDDLKDLFDGVLPKEACDEMRARLEIGKVAVVPLVMEGESFGLCVFMFSGDEPDVDLLELAAGHCTLALKAMMTGEEITRYGGIDPVTWAHSRGFFLEALEAEAVRARRYGRGLSLVLFDIDDFGEFNAQYGHSMGDRLLRLMAMTLAAPLSLPEIAARYGADEFVVLLPESNRARAVEVTARLVADLDSLSVFESSAKEQTGISASVAIVSYPEDGSSRDELLVAAEHALALAKAERRAARMPQRQLSAVQQLRLTSRRHLA